jgi:hypothetical protein
MESKRVRVLNPEKALFQLQNIRSCRWLIGDAANVKIVDTKCEADDYTLKSWYKSTTSGWLRQWSMRHDLIREARVRKHKYETAGESNTEGLLFYYSTKHLLKWQSVRLSRKASQM